MIYLKSIGIVCTLILLASAAYAEEALLWKDCVKEAKKNHPDLISAKEKVNQAKAAREVTRSTLMPQVSGTASRTTSLSPSSATGGMVSASSARRKPSTTYDYDVTGEQLVFDGFKGTFDLSGAERSVRAAKYIYDVTSSNIRLRLRTAFINLLTAQELLKVTEDIEKRRAQNAELIKLRYEGGREHKGSLMTAEADLARATYEVNQARRDIYVSQRRLVKELGRSMFAPLVAIGALEAGSADRVMPDFEKMAQTTPLLQQLIEEKEAAKYGVRSAYADFFPQVYVSGSIGNTNTRWPPDKNSWSVGGNATVPIFDGGKRRAALADAKAVLGQAKADERSGRDGVIFTLSDSWKALQDAIDNVEVQRKFLEATKERARIAEEEYSAGLLSFDNWIIIEDDLVSAKKSYVNAQASALIAEANWIQAKGGTIDDDQGQ